MDYLDLTLPTAAENLALDEALLLDAEEGLAGEVLRVWELPFHAVIVGSAGRLRADVCEEACGADGVPILRRCSGGGTVLLGPGCLVYSLILSMEPAPLRDVTHSYELILGRIAAALGQLGPTAGFAGCSDLSVGDRKFSGNSQRRKRHFLLHHGTILYRFDLALLSRYLHLPERQPAYRRQRDHRDFVVNYPASAELLKASLRSAWSADRARETWPVERVRQLMSTYLDPAWVRRR